MKRITVPVLVSFLLLSGAWPGSALAKSNRMGLRAGANLSTVSGDESADVERVTRPVAGLVGVFDLTEWLAFQFELLWSGKGAKGTLPIDFPGTESVTGELKLNYLELPLILRFLPIRNDRYQPYLYAGTGIAANLSADATGEFSDGTPLPPAADDGIDEVVTDGDLLIMGGAGVAFEFSRVILEIDARYSRGLITIDESRFSVDPKNQTWAFSAAVLFGIGE